MEVWLEDDNELMCNVYGSQDLDFLQAETSERPSRAAMERVTYDELAPSRSRNGIGRTNKTRIQPITYWVPRSHDSSLRQQKSCRTKTKTIRKPTFLKLSNNTNNKKY